MKILLVTDSHLGLYQSSDFYHGVVIDLFKEIKQYCDDNSISEVIHLGDFFDERKYLNTKTQHAAQEIADILSGLNVYLIVGNHDAYYKTTIIPTSLDIFKKYNHMHVVKEITTIHNNLVLCPWGVLPEGYDGYCFGHFDFTGFKMNNSYICERGIDAKQVINKNSFKHIFSGHFHIPSTKNTITYLGSPYQQNFNDVGSNRGYYVFENDKELSFIEYKNAPKYIYMESNDIIPDNITGNVVKLFFVEDLGSIKNQKVADEILIHKPLKYIPDFSRIKIKGTDETLDENIDTDATLLDHDDIINSYIQKTSLPNHINKKTLINMINKLREEIKEGK